jgi:hypothetical protein
MINGLAYRLPSNVVVDAIKGVQPIAQDEPAETAPAGTTEPTVDSGSLPVGSMVFIGAGVLLVGVLLIGGSR